MKLKQVPEDFIVKEISTIIPEKEGEYTYFLLKKKNHTTLTAMAKVGIMLRTPPKWFGCAGNKDKVAITEQVCSVAAISPDSLRSLDIPGIELVPLGKGNKPVSLGDLKGNQFEIVVRDVEKLPMPKTKFINYFGEQRFSTNNSEIGKAIIKKDFEQAVALLLSTKSLASLQVNKVLTSQPKNYLGALKTLPLKLLKLYVHAYQSLLWNEMAKEYASKNEQNKKIQIIGFGTHPDKEIEEVLKREGINVRDFVIKEFPELSSEGTERDVFVEAKDFKMGELEDDELNQGRKKVRLEFILPPGSYATEFVNQLFSQVRS